jgi:hypothetical protein
VLWFGASFFGICRGLGILGFFGHVWAASLHFFGALLGTKIARKTYYCKLKKNFATTWEQKKRPHFMCERSMTYLR